jgi:hypothetical protein
MPYNLNSLTAFSIMVSLVMKAICKTTVKVHNSRIKRETLLSFLLGHFEHIPDFSSKYLPISTFPIENHRIKNGVPEGKLF